MDKKNFKFVGEVIEELRTTYASASSEEIKGKSEEAFYKEKVGKIVGIIPKTYKNKQSKNIDDIIKQEIGKIAKKDTSPNEDINNHADVENIKLSAANCLRFWDINNGWYDKSFIEYDSAKDLLENIKNCCKEILVETFSQKSDDLSKRIESTQKSWADEFDRLKRDLDEARLSKDSVEVLKKQVEDILPHTLTIIGIFVAVIITIVACYLGSILQKVDYLEDENVALSQTVENLTNTLSTMSVAGTPTQIENSNGMAKAIIASARSLQSSLRTTIMGGVVLLIIFFLLYLVAKLTGRPISCYCKDGNAYDCKNCEKYKNSNENGNNQTNSKRTDESQTKASATESTQPETESAAISEDLGANPEGITDAKKDPENKEKECGTIKKFSKHYPYILAIIVVSLSVLLLLFIAGFIQNIL